jgi:hypothetical protein
MLSGKHGGDMPLNNDDIAHLLRERAWFLERLEEVKAGTYGIERRQGGEIVDERHETGRRFGDIIYSIEKVLEIEGTKFDA